MQNSAPAPRSRLGALALLGLVALTTLSVREAWADYTGRAGLVKTAAAVLSYDSEPQPTAGSVYRRNVNSADSGDLSAIASATAPRLGVGGRTTVSVSMVATLSTAVVVIVPAYETYDSATGDYLWTIGSDVTLTAQSTFTQGGGYPSPKAYVDTDGHAQMRILVKSISTSASIQTLSVRVN